MPSNMAARARGGGSRLGTLTLPSGMEPSKLTVKVGAPQEEDDDIESDFGLVSLEDSPQLDANVSQQQNPLNSGKLEPKIKFTRSWSFVESAEDRKVKVASLAKCPSANVRLDVVKRALSRTWSFTGTVQSPRPEDPNFKYSDFFKIDASKRAAPPVDCKGESPLPSPMASIDEEGDSGSNAEPVEEVDDDENVDEDEDEDEDEDKPEPEPEYKVRALSKTLVTPAEPTEKRWLALSNLDRVVNPTFSSVIHYYKGVVSETNSFSDVAKGLKESLAKVLVAFYPLAGRLALSDEGKVDLLCSGEGAVWIEAAVDRRLDEIGGPLPNHRLSGFEYARIGLGPIFIPDQITPMPVLLVQLTKFNCGSVAVATSWHHTVADGFSGTHFLRSWAEVAQGRHISVMPLHSRNLLKARGSPNPSLVNGYTSQSSDGPFSEVKASTAAPAKLGSFGLSKDKIAELKKAANLEPPPFTPRPFSSAESISGHLWRQMTKARATANSYSADSATGQPTKFFMFVDGRKRLHLPPGYFGNVVCSACAEAKEADILNKPLHYAASLIRIATRNVTEEYFRSLIDWVELQGMSSSKSEHVNSIGHDVAATFWTFFPLYDIEFGWGRPVFAARNSPPRPFIDGIAMMPNPEGQGMVALLNLHSDRMSKLQRQISFATVFH